MPRSLNSGSTGTGFAGLVPSPETTRKGTLWSRLPRGYPSISSRGSEVYRRHGRHASWEIKAQPTDDSELAPCAGIG